MKMGGVVVAYRSPAEVSNCMDAVRREIAKAEARKAIDLVDLLKWVLVVMESQERRIARSDGQ